MREACERHDVGAIIRVARRAADVTLAELGQAVGYTAASLSRMENGTQPLRDISLLRTIAEYLDIPPQELGLAPRHRHRPTPLTRVGAVVPSGHEGNDAMRRREMLASVAAVTGVVVPAPARGRARTDLSGVEDWLLYGRCNAAHDPDPTPAAVATVVRDARRDFGACRYDALARALPARFALAQALHSARHPEQATKALAELYITATRLCIKTGSDTLGAITADRARTAALTGDDVLTRAEAYRMVSSVWRRQGHYARATEIAVDAAQQLTGDRTADPAERLAAQGNLYTTAAYTAAKLGDRHTAHTLIAEAEAAATRLDRDGVLRGTAFGPSQVALHRISISHLLGDAGQAIEHARRIDVAALPSTERQGRYWLDVARAYHQWGRHEQCLRALLAAEHAAPQEVRRDSVQVMVVELLRHERAVPGVRAFARRVGALT